MLFGKKKALATNSSDDASRAPYRFADFIPYYSHYNAHTLLTKNGEVMQTIKIASNTQGLIYESGDSGASAVREIIRKAVLQSVSNDHYAFWLHIIRRRQPIAYESKHAQPFAGYVDNQWRQRHPWKFQYHNEIYLSVLREGQPADISADAKALQDTALPLRNRAYRQRYIDDSARQLERTVQAMLSVIRPHYNAEILGVRERVPVDIAPSLHEPVFFSEPMEFLGLLVNLESTSLPLPEQDIASALHTHTITFGYNGLESRSENGHKRFGALLTLKHYHEAPAETLDRALQAPCEMIISQSFSFVPARKALKFYKAQKEIFDISGDYDSIRTTGLETIIASDKKRLFDYGEEQTSVMVLVDEYKQLEPEITQVIHNFGKLGMTLVREDIMLEDAYWAQLPGNFEFVRRKDIEPTINFGGLARLNRFPTGTHVRNHWGESLVVLPTQVNSPYFFNFHVGDNGHTALLDFNAFNDHAAQELAYFLLTQALKYNGRLVVFDRASSARLWFDKLDAPYHYAEPKRPLALNPFSLEATPRNQSFLLAWLGLLLGDVATHDAHRTSLREAIASVMTQPDSARTMPAFLRLLGERDAALAAALEPALRKLGGVRWHEQDAFAAPGAIAAVDMDHALEAGGGVALFAYLLHRVIAALDGTPTIIVLREAMALLENAFFAPRLESLMEMLSQHNAMLLFTQSSPQAHADTQAMRTVLEHAASRLYLPDDISHDYAAYRLGLGGQDARLLSRMQRGNGEFLLKQAGESIALSAGLDTMGEIKAIFAGDIKNLITAGGKYATLPRN
jgi:type IV secretion system protein VirB4